MEKKGNVAEEGPLSFAEVQRLHSETVCLDTKSPAKTAKSPGKPPALDESDVNGLLNSMDRGQDFVPDWAQSNGRGDSEPSTSEQLENIRAMTSDLESSMGTLDDKMDNTKSSIEEMHREVEGTRADVAAIWEDVGMMKSQLSAIQEDFATLRKHFAALFRILTDPGTPGRALGLPPSQVINEDSVSIEPPRIQTQFGPAHKVPPVKTFPAGAGTKVGPSLASFMIGI